MIFGLVPNSSVADDVGIAYIVTRNSRFYVVAYDGIDPLTGRDRRRWHPARKRSPQLSTLPRHRPLTRQPAR